MRSEINLNCDVMLPQVSKPRSGRVRLQEKILSVVSPKSKTDRRRGHELAETINLTYHNIILPQDVDAVAWNEMFQTSIMRRMNGIINSDKKINSDVIGTIYGRISGCEFNMIAFADATLDEQKPSQEFAEALIDGCIACISHPENIENYIFPADPKYNKAKAALVYAHYAGIGLQALHRWALDNGKVDEFIACYTSFLASVKDLGEAEKLSYLMQKNPQLSPEEYEYIKREKSVYIVDSALDLIIPLDSQSQRMKAILKDLWGKSKDIFKIQLLDDISDLLEDLPDEMTISAYLMEDESFSAERKRFLSLVDEAREIAENPDKLEQLNRLKIEMITILWKSNIIPRLLNEMNNLKPNMAFIRQAKDNLGQIKGNSQSKATILTALSLLSVLQLLAVKYVEKKIKKVIGGKPSDLS